MTRRAALEGLARGLDLALVSVRQLLTDPDPEDWVDQRTSPLGRRRHCELARINTFPSARKVDGFWQVRRKDIDDYIERHPTADTEKAKESKADAEEMAEALAYRSRHSRRNA